MSLSKKYGITIVLTSQFFLCSLSVNAEVAPTPVNIIESSTTQPETTTTPQASPTDDIEQIKKEKEEIKKTTEPKTIKPKPSAKPSVAKPQPKAPIVNKVTPKKEAEKKEISKTATTLDIKNNPKSKFVLKPGKVSATTYTAQKGDNLYTLSKKFNIRYKTLLAMNNTTSPYLLIGQKVIIDKSMKPTVSFDDGIVVNIPEKKLYHFYNGQLQKTYPVSVGLPDPKWQTPVGNYKISYKVKDPIWKVPLSIQKEMAERGQVVKKEVPAGPGNPLGKWWMALAGGLGIHSTNAPLSVGYSVSHGCIRMKPNGAAELWHKAPTNTPVKLIYQPVKLSIDDNNKIFMEVYRDIYGKTPDLSKYTKNMINEYNLQNHVDWNKINYALKNKRGVSVPISKI